MKKAELLIQTMLSNPNITDDGVLANELLDEFHKGYPIESLHQLLSSKNEKLIKTAVFIASELGNSARPLLNQIVGFLLHPNRTVRTDVIGVVLTCTNENDAKILSEVVSLLNDAEWAIRWKVMEFLTLASREQLTGCLFYFKESSPTSPHISGLHWLLSKSSLSSNEIISMLRSESSIDRKYGVVAATKVNPVTQEPLNFALSSGDGDINQFARSMRVMIEESGGKL